MSTFIDTGLTHFGEMQGRLGARSAAYLRVREHRSVKPDAADRKIRKSCDTHLLRHVKQCILNVNKQGSNICQK